MIRFLSIFLVLFCLCCDISNAKIIGILSDYYQLDEDSCDGCNVNGGVFAVHEYYVNALRAACKKYDIFVTIVPFGNEAEDYYKSLDGLLVPSNRYAVNPNLYGEHPINSINLDSSSVRQTFEMNVMKQFADNDKPLLVINRGMHMLNVIYGGTLVQDLIPLQTSVKHQMLENMTHEISLQPGTQLHHIFANLTSSGKMEVNSMHRDAIKTLGNGLVASAISKDGVIEAIEVPGKHFVVGVQWNPEYLYTEYDTKLFDEFCHSVVKSKKTTKNSLLDKTADSIALN